MMNYLINISGNICELFLILFFVRDRYSTRVSKKIFVPACVFLVIFQFINTNLFLAKSNLILLASFIFIFLTLLLYKIKPTQRIIFAMFLFLANILSEVIIGMFLSILLNVNIPSIQNNYILFTMCTISSKFLTYYFILLLRQKNLKGSFTIVKQNFLLVFTLPISSIMMMLLFQRYCYQSNDNIFSTITFIASFALIVGNITVFHVMDKQNELIETKEKLIFTEKHINNQISHYKELYKYQLELKEFRHDIKNRLVALIAMIESKQNEKVLQSMKASLNVINEKNKNIVNTGNPIVDAILQSKLNAANELNIVLHLFVRFESNIKIDEIELGIILGNALDNAIDAVNKISEPTKRYINFRLISTVGRISISIQNPVNVNIDIKNLTTTKTDKNNHGLGLNSIKHISSKYDGIVSFECEDNIFSININLSNLY